MFALVKLYYVCPLNSISKNDQGTYCAKFKDGAYYDADVVTTHGSFDVLENLKQSLRSNFPRIVLSRCDDNTLLKFKQNEEYGLDVSANVIKKELSIEEFFVKEEQNDNFIDHYEDSDAFIDNDSINELPCEENSYVECLNSNALAREESVIVNNILENSSVVFHDHNYSLGRKRNDTEFISSYLSWEKFKDEYLHNSLDESQTSLQDNDRELNDYVYDRNPSYTVDENSEEVMDCNSSAPEKTPKNDQTDNDDSYEDPASLQINYVSSPDHKIHTETTTNSSSILTTQCAKNDDLEGNQEADAFLKPIKQLANCTIFRRVMTNRKIKTSNWKQEKSSSLLRVEKENEKMEGATIDSCSANAEENFVTNTNPNLNNIQEEGVFKNETNLESNFFKQTTDVMSDDDSHCQYPVYVQINEDNSSDSKVSGEIATTSTEIQTGNIPLSEEALPFYKHEVENKGSGSARKSKRYFCVYCKKLYARLPTHLERIHPGEEAVKQFCSFSKGSKQRQTLLKKMLLKSCFVYNTNRNLNNGELLVRRRPNKGKSFDADEYVPCPECKGFYLKRSLYRHYQVCNTTSTKKERRNLIPLAKITYGQIHSNACEVLKQRIFPYLKDGENVKIIRYDNLVIAYGNHLCNKYKNPKYYSIIKSSLRYMGSLLIAIKQLDPSINDFASLMVPSHVTTVVTAINNVAGLDENGRYRAPSAADGLRRICKDAAEVMKQECLKDNNAEGEQQADIFLKRFITTSCTKIYKKVKENMLKRTRTKLKCNDDEDTSFLGLTRQRWSSSTKADFYKLFQRHLENNTLPSNKQCLVAMQKIPALRSKTVAAVKTAVQNEIRRREKGK